MRWAVTQIYLQARIAPNLFICMLHIAVNQGEFQKNEETALSANSRQANAPSQGSDMGRHFTKYIIVCNELLITTYSRNLTSFH